MATGYKVVEIVLKGGETIRVGLPVSKGVRERCEGSWGPVLRPVRVLSELYRTLLMETAHFAFVVGGINSWGRCQGDAPHRVQKRLVGRRHRRRLLAHGLQQRLLEGVWRELAVQTVLNVPGADCKPQRGVWGHIDRSCLRLSPTKCSSPAPSFGRTADSSSRRGETSSRERYYCGLLSGIGSPLMSTHSVDRYPGFAMHVAWPTRES